MRAWYAKYRIQLRSGLMACIIITVSESDLRKPWISTTAAAATQNEMIIIIIVLVPLGSLTPSPLRGPAERRIIGGRYRPTESYCGSGIVTVIAVMVVVVVAVSRASRFPVPIISPAHETGGRSAAPRPPSLICFANSYRPGQTSE